MKTPWRMWYDFRNRNWWQVDLVQHGLLVAAVGTIIYLVVRLQKYGIPLMALAVLAGCGSEREQTTTTKTVETVETLTGPIVADVPLFGQVVVHPVRHVYRRTLDTVKQETEVKTLQMPEAGAILSAAAGAAPGLGVAGTILGAITTAAVGWAAVRRGRTARAEAEARETAERQRDEMIAGVERAKDRLKTVVDERMTPAWDHLKAALEAEQSRDTVATVKAKTS